MDSKDPGVCIRTAKALVKLYKHERPWSFNMDSNGPGVYIRTSKAMEF